MPLMKCPDCGSDVSSRAQACPHCGCPREFFEGDAPEKLDVGSEIKLGKYADEPLAWRVMDIDGNKALLLCENGIECMPYNEGQQNADWASCSLRKWLNSEFAANSFDEKEAARIVAVINEGDCEDKVFCLSPEEANICFNSPSDVLCSPTSHAVSAGAIVANDNGACCWWLRSHESESDAQLFIITSGDVYSRKMIKQQSGPDIANFIMKKIAVRPALWIQL